MLTRRRLIATAATAALTSMLGARLVLANAATERRFVFVIQRGAADGLATLAPVGDPAFAGHRGALAREYEGVAKIDSMFALHPSLSAIARLHAAKQALFVHAVASPYRDRSHFDGQNVLETGGAAAYALKDGWLNRLLTLLPRPEAKAIAVAATMPLALRGAVSVASYAPSKLPDASDDLLRRVSMLYANDPQLHDPWEQAMATRMLTGDMSDATGAAATGALAARLLGGDGARIAMVETGGWDTHASQRPRMAAQLAGLDAMVAALQSGLGPLWANTLVLVATEFGRTVRVNGTGGTDHGTGSVAMLLGGAVQGGRVIADWPGLAPAALFQNRDLRPTMPLDALIGAAIAEHFALDPRRTMATLFPDAGGERLPRDLMRA